VTRRHIKAWRLEGRKKRQNNPSAFPSSFVVYGVCHSQTLPVSPSRVPESLDRHSRPENQLRIRLLQAADVCFCRIYHQVIVRSPSQLPRNGPAILVSNHISGLDPLLIQSVCPRLITWMMAKEYYDLRPLNWIFRTIGLIPVDRRGRDTAATRSALRALKDGRILGVFPEGRIETSQDLLPFQNGAVRMAAKTGAPIYPVYLDGTQRGREMLGSFLYRSRSTIAFGPPIDVSGSESSDENIDRATERVRAAVMSLREVVHSNSIPRK
jgi:1-acyl-sn-glycerol-3-phosphate acyltransferase